MSITRMADCKHGASFDSECPDCGYQAGDEFTARSLREQNNRYRAALERIAVMTRSAVLDDPLFAWNIARTALTASEDDKETT